MNNKKPVTIFFACDDSYIPFLAVSLESLEQNADKNYNYDIKVLNSNSISLENKHKILDKYQYDCFNIDFVDVTPFIQKFNDKLHTRDYYSKSTYYRLFIPNMYPKLNKALYLDSDIAINGNIADLFNVELGDNYVGAIPDQSVKYLSQEFRDYVENRIGVNKYDQYFNAGILLMNLNKLREVNFEDMFLELLTKVTFNVAQDQDYLNAICKDKVTFIDETWNTMPIKTDKPMIDKPNLIHYNLSFKPWHLDNILYEEFFWEYAKQTCFYKNIVDIKSCYTKEMQRNSEMQTVNLMKLTRVQADDKAENLRIAQIIDEVCNKNGDKYGEYQYRKIARQA